LKFKTSGDTYLRVVGGTMDGSAVFSAKPLVFAASDEAYFRKHAVGFAKSSLRAGHSVHLTVTPSPGAQAASRAQKLQRKLLPFFWRQFSDEERARITVEIWSDPRIEREMGELETVIFYQSVRFFRLPALLRSYNRPVAVLDIDSLVIQPIPARPGNDVGLFLRLNEEKGRNEYERLGMKVLGAMIYAAPSGVEFFEDVSRYIDNHEPFYFLDQRALYETYLSRRNVRVFDIAETGWLDWTFKPGAVVWTAKGKRKRRNLKYVRERLKFEGRSPIASTLIIAGYRLGLLRT